MLNAGAEGKRFALPNSSVMIHQPLGGFQGQATDIDIHAKNILQTKQRLNELMAKHSAQSYERLCEDTERDNFMTANEAKTYGLIDDVIVSR